MYQLSTCSKGRKLWLYTGAVRRAHCFHVDSRSVAVGCYMDVHCGPSVSEDQLGSALQLGKQVFSMFGIRVGCWSPANLRQFGTSSVWQWHSARGKFAVTIAGSSSCLPYILSTCFSRRCWAVPVRHAVGPCLEAVGVWRHVCIMSAVWPKRHCFVEIVHCQESF
jgi:hypothetical protein